MELTNKLFKGDRVIWFVLMIFCFISIVEVFSAASTLTFKTDNYWGPISRHVLIMMGGVMIAIGLCHVPFKWYRVVPYGLLPLSIILLIAVFVFGRSTNDASRWLNIFGFQFQPSELAKLAVVTAVALILSNNQDEKGTNPKAFKAILWVTGITCVFIISENLSTALLLAFVVFLMMIVGRIPGRQMARLIAFALLAGITAVGLLVVTPAETLEKAGPLSRAVTWQSRIKSFFIVKENVPPEKYDINENYQRAHANIAIATSNVVGKMPGNSVQRDSLAQAFSDFIFAIIIEELGLAGGAFVVLLYIIILVRAGSIARKCDSSFAAFLVMGLALMMVVQAIVNMMVAVDIIPITGQPLPLISRGGTAQLINCAYIGIILSVSRYANQKEEERAAEDEKVAGSKLLASISQEPEAQPAAVEKGDAQEDVAALEALKAVQEVEPNNEKP